MSDKKDPKLAEIPFLPRELRATMEASSDLAAPNICEQVEDVLDDLLRKLCSAKQFDLQSGNCGEGCQKVEEPKIVPCLHLRWGDGPKDQLETEDTEVLCITVCNPYSNVVLKNFNVQLFVFTGAGAAVPNQADGTPSVMIKPQFNICFDDIPACDPQNPRQSCVSREVVLLSRGAVPGQYKVVALYCFEACFTKFSLREPAIFTLDLVSS